MNAIVLLHGPYADSFYSRIFNGIISYNNSRQNLIRVISVVYKRDRDKYVEIANKYSEKIDIEDVYIKDLFNPGYFNINRQIYAVNEGLKKIQDNSLVIKLRNDQCVNFSALVKIIEKNPPYNKIITTNCFTRKDRLYHPSDMFLCGFKRELECYYDMELMPETEMDLKLSIACDYINESSGRDFYTYMLAPENILFRNYLKHKNWDFKNTIEDSFEAIKKYCCVINTWDVDLRWNKKRNAFLPKGTIILPYHFSIAPFAGVPKENAACYARHDFEGHKTLRDVFFLSLSRFVFDIQYRYKLVDKEKIFNFLKKVYGSRFFPNRLRGIAVYVYEKFWRKTV